MDVREKLVELLGENTCKHDFCEDCEYCEDRDACIDYLKNSMADYLIAHGVTVNEWISVKDRLPTPKHQFDARNWYLVAMSNGVVKELAYEFHEHSVFGYGWRETAYPVIHWMPLPEPPKGE